MNNMLIIFTKMLVFGNKENADKNRPGIYSFHDVYIGDVEQQRADSQRDSAQKSKLAEKMV